MVHLQARRQAVGNGLGNGMKEKPLKIAKKSHHNVFTRGDYIQRIRALKAHATNFNMLALAVIVGTFTTVGTLQDTEPLGDDDYGQEARTFVSDTGAHTT